MSTMTNHTTGTTLADLALRFTPRRPKPATRERIDAALTALTEREQEITASILDFAQDLVADNVRSENRQAELMEDIEVFLSGTGLAMAPEDDAVVIYGEADGEAEGTGRALGRIEAVLGRIESALSRIADRR